MKLYQSIICLIAVASVASQNQSWTSSKRFFIPATKANWIGAAEHCCDIGLRFAVVDSQAKQSEIVKLANQMKASSDIDNYLWIGASELAEAGQYKWHSTGKSMSYNAWSPGEPNNLYGREHCAHLYSAPQEYTVDWPWSDGNCALKFYFVCEKDSSKGTEDLLNNALHC